MPERHVLILRLYLRDEGGLPDRLFVCEDAGSGQQTAFATPDELWRIVEATFARRPRSRSRSRAAPEAVPTPSKPSEDPT